MSRLLPSCLATTCHLTSSQPPPRLRWVHPSISLVVFPTLSTVASPEPLAQTTCSLLTTATTSSLSCSNSTSSSFILVHSLHSKLKLSAWTSAQDFSHPDLTKSTQLLQLLHIKCLNLYQAPTKKPPTTSIIIHLIRYLESIFTSLELDYDLCSTYLL